MIALGKCIVFIFVLGIFGPIGLADAEFYKFIDKDGNVQFTDNLDIVPLDQRKQVKQYEEVIHAPKIRKPAEEDEIREDGGSKEGQEGDALEDGNKKSSEQKEELLRAKEEKLHKEYEALMEEKATLDKMTTKRLTQKLRKKLKEDIADFNKRIKDYEKKREAHNKAVKTHNAQVKKETHPLPAEQTAN